MNFIKPYRSVKPRRFFFDGFFSLTDETEWPKNNSLKDYKLVVERKNNKNVNTFVWPLCLGKETIDKNLHGSTLR